MAKDNKSIEKTRTDIWDKYEKCLEYADKKAIVTKTERYWNFYVGRQWKGMKTGGEELPMLNFIKPVIKYMVSNVAAQSLTAVYTDMTDTRELEKVYEALNNYWMQSWEKSKMKEVMWRTLKSAAIQGDSYVYWENGDTLQRPQIIPNTDIFFADENSDDIQNQEYILVRERWSLKAAKKLAEDNGVPKDEIDLIGTDTSTEKQLFNKDEVSDKVTVIFYLEKSEDGKVRTARSTESVVIEPLEAIEGEKDGKKLKALEIYPIINYVWEPVPYSARGISEVEQLIANQVELNKTLARRAMAVKVGAYPRLAYDSSAIDNPEDLDKVGVAIAVNGGTAQSINQMVSYLNPASMSVDADKLTADLLQTTKDLAGVTDYAIGNINPEQASGTAINAVREQSQVPLAEQGSRVYQWVEDISMLWVDLWMAYNSDGFEFEYEKELEEDAIDPQTMQVIPKGTKVPAKAKISGEELRALKPTVKIDVSQDNEWTKLGEQQALDNFLQTGQISLMEYAQLVPENSPIPKRKLIKVAEERERKQQEQMAQQQAMLEQQQAQINQMEQIQNAPPNDGSDDVDMNMVYQMLLERGIDPEQAEELIASLG